MMLRLHYPSIFFFRIGRLTMNALSDTYIMVLVYGNKF